MIATAGDASLRQARGHIGDGCDKWEHFLNDVADVADQTGTVRGRIERVEMSLKRGFISFHFKLFIQGKKHSVHTRKNCFTMCPVKTEKKNKKKKLITQEIPNTT